jgi:murein DD-endopeptidase
MNRKRALRFFFLTALLTLCIEDGFCQEYRLSIDMRIPFMAGLVPINRIPTAYYELYLTNFSSDSMIVGKVEIFDPSDSSIVASLSKDDLAARYAMIGVPQKAGGNTGKSMLGPGNSGVIYLELPLRRDKLPLQLGHRVSIEIVKDSSESVLQVEGAFVQLPQEPPVILGRPLAGGPWAVVYDPSWQRGHRRVLYTVDGRARIPGRYAIDFIKLDSQGRWANGDDNPIKNWYGYGVDVLAVANGTVVAARDDFVESATLSEHPPCPPAKATGNYIAIDIGNNHIAFYEHLQPGSIRVKAGQIVKKGQVIAAIGFTGQTTGPHLHFHVADRDSPLGAEGIPFVFERFTVLGTYIDFEKFGKAPWTPANPIQSSSVMAEHPAPKSVIRF